MAGTRMMTLRPRHALYALLLLTPPVFGYAQGKDFVMAALEPPAPAAAPNPRFPRVTVTQAVRREIVHSVAVSGTIVPREEALASPQIEGVQVSALYFDVGDSVRKGDVLARLDRRALDVQAAQNVAERAKARAEVAQARALLAQMEASEVEAEAALRRAQTLERTGNVTAETLQTRRTAHRVAIARSAAQREAISVADAQEALISEKGQELALKLEHTEVIAPETGVISARSARVGQIASMAGEPLFRIIRDAEVEFAAEIPENSLHLVVTGQAASVSLTGMSGSLVGRVRLLMPTIDVGSRLGLARVSLPTSAAVLSGRFATGSIKAGRRDGVVVPRSAVSFGPSGTRVHVVAADRVAFRDVTVGLGDGDALEILAGLAPGESVVARAVSLLRDGDRVSPVSPEPSVGVASRAPEAD